MEVCAPCCFVFYLTTLSVAQSVLRRLVGRSMNNELGRMCKETVVTLSRHLSLEAEENPQSR
jgi:hypothetical protein